MSLSVSGTIPIHVNGDEDIKRYAIIFNASIEKYIAALGCLEYGYSQVLLLCNEELRHYYQAVLAITCAVYPKDTVKIAVSSEAEAITAHVRQLASADSGAWVLDKWFNIMKSILDVVEEVQKIQAALKSINVEETHSSYAMTNAVLKHLRQSRSLIKKLTKPLPVYTDDRADLAISSESV